MGKWSNPCGTAIQGRLVKPALQATDLVSPGKNQINIEEDTWSSYQILSWKEQILHFDLSQKAEKWCRRSVGMVSKQGKALPHDPFTLGLGSSGGKHWIHSDNVLGMGGQKVAIKDYKRPKRQRKRSQQHPMFPGGHPSKYWLDSTLLKTSVIGWELVCSMWYGRWH